MNTVQSNQQPSSLYKKLFFLTDEEGLVLLLRQQQSCLLRITSAKGTLVDVMARQGKFRCVQYLLAEGHDFAARPRRLHTRQGQREYYCPIFNHHYDRLETVACALMMLTRLQTKWQIFDAVAAKDIPLLHTFISQGCDLNRQDCLGNTALHLAVNNNCDESATLLLTYGAHCQLLNERGLTVLDLAVKNRQLDMVNLLLEHCAEVSSKALHLAASRGYSDICIRLLHFQPTAILKVLDCAEKHGRVECVAQVQQASYAHHL